MTKIALALVVLVAIVSPVSAESDAEAAAKFRRLEAISKRVLGQPKGPYGGLEPTTKVGTPPNIAGKVCTTVSQPRHSRQARGTFQRWACQ
jgi:hypothetical protein